MGQLVHKEEEEFKYTAVKDRVKLLFGEWTDDYKVKPEDKKT